MMLPNKENLVFVGRWRTSNGAFGKVENGILTIDSCEQKAFIGMKFPIDALGKCSVHPDFNLEERDRSSEGYTR